VRRECGDGLESSLEIGRLAAVDVALGCGAAGDVGELGELTGAGIPTAVVTERGCTRPAHPATSGVCPTRSVGPQWLRGEAHLAFVTGNMTVTAKLCAAFNFSALGTASLRTQSPSYGLSGNA